MKKLNKVIAVCFILMTVISASSAIASAAGNYTDTYVTTKYDGSGDHIYTPSREKQDYTSAYCKNLATSETDLAHVWVIQSKTKQTQIGNSGNIATVGTPPKIVIGQAKYLPNYVKENSCNYCNLQIEPRSHNKVWIRIAWSPDSI